MHFIVPNPWYTCENISHVASKMRSNYYFWCCLHFLCPRLLLYRKMVQCGLVCHNSSTSSRFCAKINYLLCTKRNTIVASSPRSSLFFLFDISCIKYVVVYLFHQHHLQSGDQVFIRGCQALKQRRRRTPVSIRMPEWIECMFVRPHWPHPRAMALDIKLRHPL